jgi:hypothetical protein
MICGSELGSRVAGIKIVGDQTKIERSKAAQVATQQRSCNAELLLRIADRMWTFL